MKKLWNKYVLLAVAVAIGALMGVAVDQEKMATLICALPYVTGCP